MSSCNLTLLNVLLFLVKKGWEHADIFKFAQFCMCSSKVRIMSFSGRRLMLHIICRIFFLNSFIFFISGPFIVYYAVWALLIVEILKAVWWHIVLCINVMWFFWWIHVVVLLSILPHLLMLYNTWQKTQRPGVSYVIIFYWQTSISYGLSSSL